MSNILLVLLHNEACRRVRRPPPARAYVDCGTGTPGFTGEPPAVESVGLGLGLHTRLIRTKDSVRRPASAAAGFNIHLTALGLLRACL